MEKNRSKFSTLVAADVEHTLSKYNDSLQPSIRIAVGKAAGSFAATIAFLSPEHQSAIEAIQDEIPGLASTFVYGLAVEAMRRCEMNVDGGGRNLPFAPAIDTRNNAYKVTAGRGDDLDSMLIEDWAGRVAGSTYLEEHFRIPRSTLNWWQRHQYVIALRKGGRKHVFPLAQFVDGRPVAGIQDVLSCIGNPRLAWFWLARPASDLDGRVPIEMLRHDLIQDVVRAARAFSSKQELSN